MTNRELFRRDPVTSRLANDGQARILDSSENQRAVEMLRYELEHFVCEGQYAAGTQRILDSYLSNLSSASQRAAWVSGFYGSGKSHLLKMLCHLWRNTSFNDGTTARGLVPDLPADTVASLKELDTQGRRLGGLFAASGTMPEGSTESARLTVLGILFRACGLPTSYNQARFCLYLKEQGYLEKMKAAVEAAGRTFSRELTDLYVSPVIRKALLECDSSLGDEKDVRQLLRDQFPNVTDIDTAEFVRIVREILQTEGEGEIPLTILVLDEVQHYIADDRDRSREITELTEALNKQMDSRLIVVAAGQNALSTDTPQFAWLRDRFTIRVELSDADVETVTRKVLLAKKPEGIDSLRKELDKHAGEIERHLVKTRIGPTARDREWLVPDYPILPTRRRFWEHAIRAVDPTGSSSLLRTQLRMTHEALRQVAEKPAGHVIPGDLMFFQQQPALVQQGALSREISDRIQRLDDATARGRLLARICGLIFLIRRLPRESGADIGVRANIDTLADLLVSDLANDGTQLRRDLPRLLNDLVEMGILLSDGGEYNLQTRESAAWDDKFRREIARLRQDTAALSHERTNHLKSAVETELKNIKLRQGASQTPRQIDLHFGLEAPEETGKEVPVWVQDAWNSKDSLIKDAARSAGAESATLFVFLPKAKDNSLQENLLRMKAAQSVLDHKGVPTTNEAEEARNAMETRRDDAKRNVGLVVKEILSSAKVFKGGGTEVHSLELADKIRDAAEDSLNRLFPRFTEADHKAWELVIRRSRQGDDTPLQAVNWNQSTEEHPVCKEILRHVGSGKEGRHLRAHFEKPPYGWPRDGIDAALICLHAAGHLLARDHRTSESIQASHLDQNRIPKAEFRTESITLKATDRIALRGLFQFAGITVKRDDDLDAKATEFIDTLLERGKQAGGEPPLPQPPNVTYLEEIRKLSGNERLNELLQRKSHIEHQAGEWKELAELAKKRTAQWEKLKKLLNAGGELEALKPVHESKVAIELDRLLLDSTDHVVPLVKKASEILRDTWTKRRTAYAEVRERELARLEAADTWEQLSEDQKETLLTAHPLPETTEQPVSTEGELLAALQQIPLNVWRDRTDALPGRVDALLSAAAHLLEPKAQPVTLPGATIHTPEEFDAWVEKVRREVEQKLKDGPVIL